MNANVSIFIDSKTNVVLVPIEAVYEEGGQSFVQILEEGMPVAKEVTIGLTSDRFAEVISGLEPGTMVVVGSSMDMMDHGFGPGGPSEKPVQY
jgi:multidrug efflux pump subunit AcrA (membrane-fusion protein)